MLSLLISNTTKESTLVFPDVQPVN